MFIRVCLRGSKDLRFLPNKRQNYFCAAHKLDSFVKMQVPQGILAGACLSPDVIDLDDACSISAGCSDRPGLPGLLLSGLEDGFGLDEDWGPRCVGSKLGRAKQRDEGFPFGRDDGSGPQGVDSRSGRAQQQDIDFPQTRADGTGSFGNCWIVTGPGRQLDLPHRTSRSS